MAPPSIRSARAMAAVMARSLATIIEALRPAWACSSASAMARADAVRFSILDDAADSERKRTAANGAISWPSSASKRATSAAASSTTAAVSDESGTERPAIFGGSAAR
jgi:hypothetical protein